tara:strand:+ start:318 stop:536 length:219 start_codon:yes stop_codon:yes gene_type:complete
MIYRISLTTDEYGHLGYWYESTLADAKRRASALAKEHEVDIREVRIEKEPTPRTKKDVIKMLEIWGYHPDNG